MSQSGSRDELDAKMARERARMALLAALDQALDLADEGWTYASDYFRKKWQFEERFAALRGVLEEFDDR